MKHFIGLVQDYPNVSGWGRGSHMAFVAAYDKPKSKYKTNIQGNISTYWTSEPKPGDILDIHPITGEPAENYSVFLINVGMFKDLGAVSDFFVKSMKRQSVSWVEVTPEVWATLSGSAWYDAVMNVVTDHNLDFVQNEKSDILSNKIARCEVLSFLSDSTKCKTVLKEWLETNNVPGEIIKFLLT